MRRAGQPRRLCPALALCLVAAAAIPLWLNTTVTSTSNTNPSSDAQQLEAEAVAEVMREWAALHPDRADPGLRAEWGRAPWAEHASVAEAEDGPDLPRHRAWLQRLRAGEVEAVERLPGIGVTLAFVVRFAGTADWAFFKPHTCGAEPAPCVAFAGDVAYREALAYHLDKVLAFNRTIPTVGRRLPLSWFEPLLGEAVAAGGWGRYRPHRLRQLWVKTMAADGSGAVLGALSAGLNLLQPAPRPSLPDRDAAEVRVFDFLTQQRDRPATANAHNKVVLVTSLGRTAGAEYGLFPGLIPGKSILYMDNGRTFPPEPMEGAIGLDAVGCQLARNLCERLHRVGVYCGGHYQLHDDPSSHLLTARLRASMGAGDRVFAPWLTEAVLAGVRQRAKQLGAHIEACIASTGKEQTLSL